MELAKLKECLEKHLKWLKGEDGGERANFDYEDLRGASLDNASLRGASLVGASLDNASLDGASLDNASLDGASLRSASLDDASLVGASLVGASLDGASLRSASLDDASLVGASLDNASLDGASLDNASLDGASLYGASLVGASLVGASLDDASLVGASLDNASLDGASLDDASLYGASLYGASLAPELVAKFFPLACPEDGAFIAWKKCGDCIVKLLIPADALRSSAFGRKCRASKAECLEIQNIDGTQTTLREVHSGYDHTFVYRIGQMATVENFDTDRTHECAPGIHFFITRQEAVDYQ